MHAMVGRKHLRLFERFAHHFAGTATETPSEQEPRALFRGARCIICGRTVIDSERLTLGSHPTCRAKVTTPAP